MQNVRCTMCIKKTSEKIGGKGTHEHNNCEQCLRGKVIMLTSCAASTFLQMLPYLEILHETKTTKI
jgi:hypothetical protein